MDKRPRKPRGKASQREAAKIGDRVRTADDRQRSEILVAERPGLGSLCDPGFEQVSDISALLLGDGRKPRQRRPCSSIKTRDVADRENLRTPRHRAVRLRL